MLKDKSKGKILVVEDEVPLSDIIAHKLNTTGFDVVQVRTVEDALRELNEGTFHAVWLDHYLLGEKDGLDLVESMKSSEGYLKDLPVFVVSNTASDQKVKKYIQLGVTEYYVKAVNKLLQIISDVEHHVAPAM